MKIQEQLFFSANKIVSIFINIIWFSEVVHVCVAASSTLSLEIKTTESDAAVIAAAQIFWVYFDIRAEVSKSKKS